MTTPKVPLPTCDVCVACGDTDCLRNRLAAAQATADRRGKLLERAAQWFEDASRPGDWQPVLEDIRAELEGT